MSHGMLKICETLLIKIMEKNLMVRNKFHVLYYTYGIIKRKYVVRSATKSEGTASHNSIFDGYSLRVAG